VPRQFFSIRPTRSPQTHRWGLRSRASWLHAPALAIALGTAALVSSRIDNAEQAARAAFDNQRRVALLGEFEAAVLEAQNSHRAYLLAGTESSLDGYREGVRSFWGTYGELKHGGSDGEARTLAEVVTLFQRWQSSYAEPSIERRRTVARETLPRTGGPGVDNDALISSIREKTGTLRGEARSALEASSDRAHQAFATGKLAGILGPTALLGAMVAAGLWLALRTVKALDGLRAAADRFADGDLDVRADVAGSEETRAVAQAFNGMASQLSQRTARASLLTEIGETLQACASFDEACKVLAQVAPRLLPETSGALSVFNASRNAVLPVATWGAHLGEAQGFDPNDCWSLRKGRVHLYRPPRHGVSCPHVHGNDGHAAHVCIPMTAQGDPIGVLHLQFPENSSLHDVNDSVELATTAAERFVLALANLRLRDSLRDRSIRDALTGLYNRRYLEETLDREFGRAERSNQAVSIMVIDIDHFKRFNDQRGHEAGDAVLAHIGRLLAEFFRTSDIPCRYGGEEFVVVLPDAAISNAVHRAETLRDVVSAQTVEHRGTLLGPVTLSIGVASFPTNGSQPDEVLRSADAALYLAKKQGRNRVSVAPEETQPNCRPSMPTRRSAA